MILLRFLLPLFVFSTLAFSGYAANTAPSSSNNDSSYNSGDKTLAAAEKLIKRRKYAKAAEELKIITGKDAGNANAWNLYGFASRKDGDTATARRAYDKALALDPGHLGANAYLGELFIQTGDIEGAKAQLRKLEKLCPQGCKAKSELEQALASVS